MQTYETEARYVCGSAFYRERDEVKTRSDGNCLLDALHIVKTGRKLPDEDIPGIRKNIAENVDDDAIEATLVQMITEYLKEGNVPQGLGARTSALINQGLSSLTPNKPAKQPAAQKVVSSPKMPAIRIGATRAQPKVTPSASAFSATRADGTQMAVQKLKDGRTVFTAPPPPVREITFSGGGGKGVALPGAVKALEESGVLKNVTKVSGASVGSMTAALVAAGITAEEFAEVANAKETTARITEGSGGTKLGMLGAALKNRGSPLTGNGLETIVREVLDETLRKRILGYVQQCTGEGKSPDATVVAIATRLASNKAGPTFGDLRKLSKVIPAIKEIVITGTYTTEFDKDSGTGKTTELKAGNTQGQLYVFDADSEPDLEVATAVHASASFPVAFKPVDIKLSSGLTVRFIDGGVMNNTPTSSSIGSERDLDPMPQKRGITFVFEDKDGVSKGLLDGKVSPDQGKMARIVDWFLDSDHKGSEYAKNRDMVDRPEEIVEVPLKVTMAGKKWYQKKKYDMRDGTLEFNLPDDVKVKLQEETEKATKKQIDREKQPKNREFSSDSEMFVSLPMADLRVLAKDKYPRADQAVTFREQVAKTINELRAAVANQPGGAATVIQDKNTNKALTDLDKLAGDDKDFQAYVGREMNRGQLDTVLDAMKKAGRPGGGAMKAALKVSEALRVHTWADNVLKQVVYPKMKTEREGGAGIEMLLQTEKKLRTAVTPEEFNGSLKTAIGHYRRKPDRSKPSRGHKEFAMALVDRLMLEH